MRNVTSGVHSKFFGYEKYNIRKQKNAIILQYYNLIGILTRNFARSGYPPKFIVAVIGKTNSKKTTCSLMFCKLFGRKTNMVCDISFNSTEAAIYQIMERYSDAVVIIDDFVPAESSAEARAEQAKLEIIERGYGDRTPRKRCTAFAKDSNVKEFYPIGGCALITGETFAGRKSSQSRAIQLNFQEGDVDDEILSFYQKNLEIMPAASFLFIEFVTENQGWAEDVIKKEVAFWRKELKNSIKTPRFRDAFGIFASTAKIFSRFLKEYGVYTDADADKLLKDDLAQIYNIIKENDDNLQVIDPFTAVVEAINHSIREGRLKLVHLDELEAPDQAGEYLIDAGEYYLITADRLYKHTKEYFAYTGKYFMFKSGRELIGILAQEKAIWEKKEGQCKRKTHKITIKGHLVNQRFLHILKEKMQEKISQIEKF